MYPFDLYPQAWALYIALGLLLLFLLDLKLKKYAFKWRIGVLSLIAVGAFTPQQVLNADSLAPMILTSLLNAEVEGVSAIYQGLLTLLLLWGILFASILAIRHFIEAKKAKPDATPAQKPE